VQGHREEAGVTGKAGDRITVDGKKGAARTGEILEVIPATFGIRYEVLWSDGHRSTFSPSGGSVRIVEAPNRRRGKTPR